MTAGGLAVEVGDVVAFLVLSDPGALLTQAILVGSTAARDAFLKTKLKGIFLVGDSGGQGEQGQSGHESSPEVAC